MRRHKKSPSQLARTGNKTASTLSYSNSPSSRRSHPGQRKSLSLSHEELVQNTSEGLSTSIESFFFSLYHTARIQPNKMHDTGKDL